MARLQLVPIREDGGVEVPAADLATVPADVLSSTVALYAARGFRPPFIGYLAIEAGRPVGTCAFTAPPAAGCVEIAYFTFPGEEGRGVATAMARALVALARAADPALALCAHTLPAAGPSAAILRRLGFAFAGGVDHPEDGPVWAWRLAPDGLPAATAPA